MVDKAWSRDCGDVQISRLQTEIDQESENRSELARRAQAAGADRKLKSLIETRVEKSDQKLDSMTVLMLHYCAGLQHCLDQEEMERLRQLEEEKRGSQPEEDGDRTCTNGDGAEASVLAVECNVTDVSASSSVELNSTVTAASQVSECTEPDDNELPMTVAATAAEPMTEADVETDVRIVLNNDDDDDGAVGL